MIFTTGEDWLAGVLSSLAVVSAALAIALARIHARVTRLEEWVRIREIRNNRPTSPTGRKKGV